MAKCPICGEKIPMLTKAKTSDGVICFRCASICASYATLPTTTIKSYWDINKARWNTFTATQILKSFASGAVTIDETHRFFIFGNVKKLKVRPIVYSFDEVEGYEFETVGGKTEIKTKGSLTRAMVGGVIAGPVGAIVGSTTAKQEVKTVGGMQLIKVRLKTYAGIIYQTSSNCTMGFTGFLDRCMEESQNSSGESVSSISAADEILKYKALRDEGIITEEEFQKKKSQLLDQ